MTNEIDSLKQKADNTAQVSELQSKIVAMEKDAAKLKRITEVFSCCVLEKFKLII